MATNTDPSDQYLNTPMSIEAAASMFRKKVGYNEKPYTQTIIKLNNQLVDRWYNEVLIKIADSKGMIHAGRVYPSWLIFYEGMEVYRARPFLDHLNHYTLEEIDYWVQFFTTKSLEDMVAAGSATISNGWQYLTGAIRYHFALQKWEHIYSKSTDPLAWDKEASKHSQLMRGEPAPYGLDKDKFSDAAEKVNTIMSNRIEPRQ